MFEAVPVKFGSQSIGAEEPDDVQPVLELQPPATFDDCIRLTAPGDQLSLGRTDAALAMQTLLQVVHEGRTIQAVNVTDEIACG